jgi:soluble lytic murein transglycosylase-like protein
MQRAWCDECRDEADAGPHDARLSAKLRPFALTPPQAQEAYRRAVQATGIWRTSGDGLGATLHDNAGNPVRTDAGRPVEIRFNEDFRAPAIRNTGLSGVVRSEAERQGVNPDLAARVAQAESGMGAALESPVGALGLMQVMPGTGAELARELGVPHDLARLKNDHAYNARMGVAYLRKMLDRYQGNEALALAAYNAGPGRVDEYVAGRRGLPAETIEYVRKITGSSAAVTSGRLSFTGR